MCLHILSFSRLQGWKAETRWVIAQYEDGQTESPSDDHGMIEKDFPRLIRDYRMQYCRGTFNSARAKALSF